MSATLTKIAFRYDIDPAISPRVETIQPPRDQRFFVKTVLITLICHLILLSMNPDWFFSVPLVSLEESISVDADFMPEVSTGSPQENAMPNAKKSEDVAVPSNLLPQLPKKFEVEQNVKADEKPVVEEKDQKPDDPLAKKPDTVSEQLESPKTKDDPNKVTKEDLLKRLAVERLKRENKVDKQMKAQKDALAKLKEELLAKDARSSSAFGSNSGISGSRARNYADVLRAAVKRNLYLPKNFEYDRAQLVTQLSVVINAKGELVEVKLARSSGNGAYDQAAIAALQNSVPLPQPPAEIAGQSITFNLSK